MVSWRETAAVGVGQSDVSVRVTIGLSPGRHRSLWSLLLLWMCTIAVQTSPVPSRTFENITSTPSPVTTLRPQGYEQSTDDSVVDVENLLLLETGFMMPSNKTKNCRLRPVEDGVYEEIVEILERQAKLIYLRLSVKGYAVNPLETENTWSYKTDEWARVGSSHGQTILNLAFNYGVLSLMTLNFGVLKKNVELEDVPYGCVGNLNEVEKIDVVLDIAMRDFKEGGDYVVVEEHGSVCHQIIKDTGSSSLKFTHRICARKRESDDVVCRADYVNQWLDMLDVLLAVLIFGVFVFGPALTPDWLYAAALETNSYYVKLKEPLYKTICVCRRGLANDITAKHTLDLRDRKDFIMCRRIVSELPSDAVIPIKISQFDILVSYRKLLPENKVPVGMMECISRALFLCKLRELDPFRDCCEANLCGCCPRARPRPWIGLCTLIGKMLLVLLTPLAFYVRLGVYYVFEHPEIVDRQEAADQLGMPIEYNYRLLRYLTPTHTVFLAAYVFYFSAGFLLAWLSGRPTKTRYQEAIIDSFSDLKNLSMLNALSMVIKNCLWPFKKFGIWGCFLGLLYWPLIMPVSIGVCVLYCIPLVFLTIRVLKYSMKDDDDQETIKSRAEDQNEEVKQFETDKILKRPRLRNPTDSCYCDIDVKRLTASILTAAFGLLTIYSIMLMAAEVIGFVAEVICFTMMGLIVNASKVLKYGTLIFLVVIYSYDTYNNVNKKYLKLNKALFSEIKNRLGSDINAFTSLPSWIQGNRGFKAVEASQQADYESTDDLSKDHTYHMDINDLILFIDSEDNPRIPRKLFDDVCGIQVAGSPGPVYRSLLQATWKFMVIIFFIVFVFIVVLSFGENYKMSSTNQMLATMAGGFMPFIFRHVLKPGSAEVETGLVSFRSKLEEIIQNFMQPWPMYDFQFEVEEEPKEEGEAEVIEDEEGKGDVEDDEDEDGEDGAYEKGQQMMLGPMIDLTGGQAMPVAKDKNANHMDKKDKSGGSKSKDDKKKDGEEQQLGALQPQPGQNINYRQMQNQLVRSVKTKVEELESKLKPAEGQEVDILIFVQETDQEWLMEWSSVCNMNEVALELKENNLQLMNESKA